MGLSVAGGRGKAGQVWESWEGDGPSGLSPFCPGGLGDTPAAELSPRSQGLVPSSLSTCEDSPGIVIPLPRAQVSRLWKGQQSERRGLWVWVPQQSGALVDRAPSEQDEGEGRLSCTSHPAEICGTRLQRGPSGETSMTGTAADAFGNLLCRAGQAGGLGPTSEGWAGRHKE